MKQKIVVTIGDPAGCGPYIALKAIQECRRRLEFFVVGDREILERNPLFRKAIKKIIFIDSKTKRINKIRPGYPSSLTGLASLNYLKRAIGIINQEKIAALVTAPVSKEAVKLNLSSFKGHTEFLAGIFGVSNFAMMMVSSRLKVVLLTRHVPLRDVPAALGESLIIDNINLVHCFLRDKFKIKKPRIVFASFNPHAGINTFLGREEKIIKSALEESPHAVYGPYPADTLFLKDKIRNYDCIISVYHDQAMIPFKLLSFTRGVNLTLGLPIIRTSPAHGVAFDLMRSAKIPLHLSMLEAINLSSKLSQ